jgi:hypothetical protein
MIPVAGSLDEHVDVGHEPGDERVGRLEGVPVLLTQHHPAGRRDHRWLGAVQRVQQGGRLEHAIGGLTVGAPDLADGAPGALLDHLVGVDERPPQPSGEELANRRLARAHQPDEDDVPGVRTVHHNRSAPNACIAGSAVTSRASSMIAWAASIRSKGSP